jgi:hypothetical protein
LDRAEFIAAEGEPWWLLDPHLDSQTEELRVALGAAFGWSDPLWYADRENNLAIVYDWIDANDRQLWDTLDAADDDEDARREWLRSLLALRRPADQGDDDSTLDRQAIHETVSGVSPEFVTSLAHDLGVSPDEVREMLRDPEMETMVAEAVQQMTQTGS